MKTQFDTKTFVIALALVAAGSQAFAAPPTTTDPGMINKGMMEERRAPSRIEETVVVPKDEASGKGLSDKKVFTLKAVILDGSTAYTNADIAPLFKDMVGQMVSFADLNTIAQRVTRKYREDGYIFSRAVLPPQKISDGVVHLEAVEGRIANVELVGNFHDNNGLIHRMAEKIKSSSAANTKEIERYLLLIDDLPGITAKSFVKPSVVKGGGDLIIEVQEDLFEGSASIDNRGSRYLGPWRGTLVGAFNDVLGLHDRTTIRGIMTSQTDELKFADIYHEEQIGADGFKIKGRAAITSANPDVPASPAIDGESLLFDMEAVYPLVRGRQYNFNLVGGMNVLNSHTDLAGLRISTDRVRSARAGATFDFTDPLRGVNQFEVLGIQGLDIWNATNDNNVPARSRANGDQTFLKGTLTATRVQELWDLFSLMLTGTGQVSRDPLLASEEFAVGGGSYGRAYDAGEITGDSGWAGAAELRYGGPVQNQFLQSYQVYTYLDYGKVDNKSPAVGEAAEDSLTSAGLGLRFNVVHSWTGYVELDTPLNKEVASEGDRDSRLFFSVLKRF
ncbi:MAG: ShlB/FhaC/HecB family hemolysin secretion/activation protein [Alphaproteobacteria bacterium]